MYGQTETERDARALLIIRAVNAFEPMAAALKAINIRVSDAYDEVSDQTSAGRDARCIFKAVSKCARAAIEKAEER